MVEQAVLNVISGAKKKQSRDLFFFGLMLIASTCAVFYFVLSLGGEISGFVCTCTLCALVFAMGVYFVQQGISLAGINIKSIKEVSILKIINDFKNAPVGGVITNKIKIHAKTDNGKFLYFIISPGKKKSTSELFNILFGKFSCGGFTGAEAEPISINY